MKDKAVNEVKMRATKDMKLNFNKSFQTDELNSDQANKFFITDIKVVSGPKGPVKLDSSNLGSEGTIKVSPQVGIGDPAYESAGEQRNEAVQSSITSREKTQDKMLPVGRDQ